MYSAPFPLESTLSLRTTVTFILDGTRRVLEGSSTSLPRSHFRERLTDAKVALAFTLSGASDLTLPEKAA